MCRRKSMIKNKSTSEPAYDNLGSETHIGAKIMKRWLIIGGLMFLSVAGCENTLETGYKPNALNATDSRRRAYYAAPYSPEAQAAGADEGAVRLRPGGDR